MVNSDEKIDNELKTHLDDIRNVIHEFKTTDHVIPPKSYNILKGQCLKFINKIRNKINIEYDASYINTCIEPIINWFKEDYLEETEEDFGEEY